MPPLFVIKRSSEKSQVATLAIACPSQLRVRHPEFGYLDVCCPGANRPRAPGGIAPWMPTGRGRLIARSSALSHPDDCFWEKRTSALVDCRQSTRTVSVRPQSASQLDQVDFRRLDVRTRRKAGGVIVALRKLQFLLPRPRGSRTAGNPTYVSGNKTLRVHSTQRRRYEYVGSWDRHAAPGLIAAGV